MDGVTIVEPLEKARRRRHANEQLAGVSWVCTAAGIAAGQPSPPHAVEPLQLMLYLLLQDWADWLIEPMAELRIPAGLTLPAIVFRSRLILRAPNGTGQDPLVYYLGVASDPPRDIGARQFLHPHPDLPKRYERN